MGIFPRGFVDHVDVLHPRQCTLSKPTEFGFVVPGVTPKITCARAHLNIRDVLRNIFQPRDSSGVWSIGSLTVWGNTPVPGLGVLANENMSQVLQMYLKIRHRQHTRAV